MPLGTDLLRQGARALSGALDLARSALAGVTDSAPPPAPSPVAARQARPAVDLALLRQTLDRLHHAVMVVALDRTILYANPAMCQYVALVTRREWTPDELVGRDVMEFHPEGAVPGTNARFDAMEGAEPLTPRTNPIEHLVFMTWDARITDEDGRVVAFVLEKYPASYNPDPLPDKTVRALRDIRRRFRAPRAGRRDR